MNNIKVKLHFLGLMILLALIANCSEHFNLPLAKLTIRVVDEQIVPIKGARVDLVFKDPVTRQGLALSGLSDASGLFTAEGGSDSVIPGSIYKSGYYASGFPFEPLRDIKDGRWQPWNQTVQTILRPIGKPVALYAKKAWIEIPAIGEPCGFDLEKGDWVAPRGKGFISDFIFKLERRYVSREDFDVNVELSFGHSSDGVQEAQWPAIGKYSVFIWQREASENGYQPTLRTTLSSGLTTGYKASATEDQGYFFRVRTVEENGQIVSSRYGKIRGGLELAPSNSKTCKVKLNYYLNPTPLDRNLEWDTKHNLLIGLGEFESPRDP